MRGREGNQRERGAGTDCGKQTSKQRQRQTDTNRQTNTETDAHKDKGRARGGFSPVRYLNIFKRMQLASLHSIRLISLLPVHWYE